MGPLSVVHEHVGAQVARGGEGARAQRTLVRLFLDVRHLVVVEVGRGGEPLATHTALVGLLTAVDPPVGVQ